MAVSSSDAEDGPRPRREPSRAWPLVRVSCAELVRDSAAVVAKLATPGDSHAAGHHGAGQDARGPVQVPAGLASIRPGPELSLALSEIAVRGVRGRDTVDVMTAAYRQSCHAQAVFLKALLETGMRRAHSGSTVSRVEHPGEFAAEEARAALVWSRRRSDTTFEFAWDVHDRLPMLGEAMYAGNLDEPRARAFTQWTTGLTDDQAAQIITKLLPQAAELLVGELIDRIKRMAITIDPQWAERRYRAAVNGRRVEGSRNDDGTANIHGLDLPVDRAAAACDRVDTLARSCKHAGDRRPINHIRADLYLGMLDGTFEHLSEDEIITHLLNHPTTDTDTDHGSSGNGPGDGDPSGSDDDHGDGPSDDGHDGDGDDDDGSSDDRGDGDDADPSGGSTDDGPGDDAGSGSGSADHSDRHDRGGPNPRGTARHGPAAADPAETDPAKAEPAKSTSAGPDVGAWPVRELRVELATALGLNEHPAEIVGWDVVTAALARTLITSMLGAQWRWVICDHHGHPIDSGITRRRPPPPTGAGGRTPRDTRRRRGIVELQIRADDLPDLAAGAGGHGAWTAVIADILTQHHTPTTNADDAAARDAHRRSARAPLRRTVQIRDRRCTHPTCRAPATRSDQDHAEDHAHGGLSTDANLGCCCRHDHRLKHDGGWRVTKPAPDITVWTSPMGHTYTNRPPPIMPTLPQQWLATDATDTKATPRNEGRSADELPHTLGDPADDAPPF